jgi:hypothetical protein
VSVFRDLLQRAKDAGAERVAFDVRLDGFFSAPDLEAWVATSHPRYAITTGRSGEEALRRLVDALERSA